MPDYALQFDGSQNYLDVGALGNFGSNLGSGFYCKFNIKTTSTAIMAILGIIYGAPYILQVLINDKYDDTSSVTNGICVYMTDTSGFSHRLTGGIQTSSVSITDGIKHSIEITAIPSTNTITINIDNNPQTIAYGSQGTPATFANFTSHIYVGARDNGGSIEDYFNGTLDNVKLGTSSSVLYGSYAMDDGSGTNVADSSGQGNNGTLKKGVGSYPSWVTGLDPIINSLGLLGVGS